MIHIVTGRINSGKTTTLTNLYQTTNKGDGFVSVKRMHYDKVHGYDLMQLSNLATKRFVVHQDYWNNTDKIACQIGPYLFCQTTISAIEQQVQTWIKQGISPIYLDEIGVLELQDKCFANALNRCIANGVTTYITVRSDLVDDVVNHFHITDYQLIQPQ